MANLSGRTARAPSFAAWLAAGLALAAPETALAAEKVRMMADLTGAQVVGAAADSDGSGRLIASLEPKSRRLCYELEVRLIGQATAAAIYSGRTGRSPGAGLVSLAVPDARGNAKGCVTVSRSAARQFSSDPSVAHVSVFNALYPAGALRGQLAAGGPGLDAAEGSYVPTAAAPVATPAPRGKAADGAGYTGPAFIGS